MPFTNAFCVSFKDELLEGVHDFRVSPNGDAFKLAMYTNSANFDQTTTAYTATNEVTGTGYTAGGGALTNVSPIVSGTTAFTDFSPDLVFSAATITAFGALIYNSTPAHTYTNPACVVLDFGGSRTSTAGDFTIVFPAANSSAAIIRIA